MTIFQNLQNSIKVFTKTYKYLKMSEDSEKDICNLKQEWAKSILDHLHVNLTIKGIPSNKESMIFVGNHISYLDIPLLMSSVSDIAFVAKSELKSWPVFGPAASQVNTVFVNRNCGDSRKSARETIKNAISNGQRIVIFPSGTTSMDESRTWKRGAFEIAHELKIPIQAFKISYRPLRTAAYIDKDFFPAHLYNLTSKNNIEAHIEFAPPSQISDPNFDCLKWNYWSRGLLNDEIH